MRRIAAVLLLTLTLAPAALRAESAMCEYRHPGHPSWDFFAACTVTVTDNGGATLREVSVSNGSRFTTRDEGERHSVNGLAAQKLAQDGAECWRTEAENELICIHPASASAPAAPMPAPGGEPPALADTGFGGGTAGFCLLVENGAVLEYGPCLRRENCLQLTDSKGESCLADYDWASGRITEMARADDWQTLDGGLVVAGDPGCVVDTVAALTFCYATKAMTAATHPVLATAADTPPEAPAVE